MPYFPHTRTWLVIAERSNVSLVSLSRRSREEQDRDSTSGVMNAMKADFGFFHSELGRWQSYLEKKTDTICFSSVANDYHRRRHFLSFDRSAEKKINISTEQMHRCIPIKSLDWHSFLLCLSLSEKKKRRQQRQRRRSSCLFTEILQQMKSKT